LKELSQKVRRANPEPKTDLNLTCLKTQRARLKEISRVLFFSAKLPI